MCKVSLGSWKPVQPTAKRVSACGCQVSFARAAAAAQSSTAKPREAKATPDTGEADAPKVGADVILMGGAALITPKQNEDKHVLYTVLGCGVSNFSAF